MIVKVKRKKDNLTLYIGDNSWHSTNYKSDIEQINNNLEKIIRELFPHYELTKTVEYEQIIFYLSNLYVISFFNIYTNNYKEKMDILVQKYKQNHFVVVSLNKIGKDLNQLKNKLLFSIAN